MYGCVKGGFWRVAEGSEGAGLWTVGVKSLQVAGVGSGGKELWRVVDEDLRELVETDVL